MEIWKGFSFYSKIGALLGFASIFVGLSHFCSAECEFNFISEPGGPRTGIFTAPNLTNPFNHSIVCVYTFMAGENEKVQITFTAFELRGTPPECLHEYMDVYTEISNNSVESIDLISVPFDGRYCGSISPRSRVSLFRTVAFDFYTDKTITTPDVFVGEYTFINETDYMVGTPVPNTACSFTIPATAEKKGVIVSPTYPGAYPKPLECSYLFTGKKKQRVHLEFRDFDLFSGGTHCPFDAVTVYDGRNASAPLIGTYCGQHRNLILYSTRESLFFTFTTIERTANTQNRGFKGFYEFSENFVSLDFIGKNGGEHIPGTECDQKILSKKESTGFVFSPNYPFPYSPKTVCRYFIYGMQDVQNLERIRLEFSMFEIPMGDGKEECNDRYLKIYLKGQETTDSYDKFDYEYCGNEIPTPVVSEGPRLVLIFASGESSARGFKAKYIFETEYLIPGTPAPGGICSFTYRGIGLRKQGEFNSPRHPANYPSSTDCNYTFLATSLEQVSIIFDHFRVRADKADNTKPQFGEIACQEDWLEMYNIYRDGTESRIGRYCGFTAPGPVESVRGAAGIRVLFHTDESGILGGFKAKYSFERSKPVFGDCGANISNAEFGVIESPDYPSKYTGPSASAKSIIKSCNWFLTVRPGYRIFLNFTTLVLEGSPATRGCSAVVVRLWLNESEPPIEICGENDPELENYFLSANNHIRLSFLVADKSSGGGGFQLNWTEVSLSPDICEGFRCAGSGLCIPKSLHCNGVPNCGILDDVSDEIGCTPEESDRNVWQVLAIVAVVLVIFCTCCCIFIVLRNCCRRSRDVVRNLPPPPPLRSFSERPHLCDEIGQRFANMESV